jgi:hypothetical protein
MFFARTVSLALAILLCAAVGVGDARTTAPKRKKRARRR